MLTQRYHWYHWNGTIGTKGKEPVDSSVGVILYFKRQQGATNNTWYSSFYMPSTQYNFAFTQSRRAPIVSYRYLARRVTSFSISRPLSLVIGSVTALPYNSSNSEKPVDSWLQYKQTTVDFLTQRTNIPNKIHRFPLIEAVSWNLSKLKQWELAPDCKRETKITA